MQIGGAREKAHVWTDGPKRQGRASEDERLGRGAGTASPDQLVLVVPRAGGEAGSLDTSSHRILKVFTEGSWVNGLRIFIGPFPDNLDVVLLG